VKRAVALACLLWLWPAFVVAQENIEDSFSNDYHLEGYRVAVNDVVVAKNAAVYIGNDETVYVSDDELDAWNLKHPRTPAFERDRHAYFGLQTDLALATTFNREEGTLEIVAPPTAFRGEPGTQRPELTPGRGAFMNYNLNALRQRYDMYAVSQGGIYQLSYIGMTDTQFAFRRSVLRWLQFDQTNHTAIVVGDSTSNGGWLGTSVTYGGIHYATDYTTDPQWVARQPPTVSGYANAPSLLEVYINNVLEIRRSIPEGPFTVSDLPIWAANSDIVLVLTDALGHKTVLQERPSYNPSFVGRGRTDFVIDTGVAKQNADQPNQFYSGFVGQSTVRYGLTDKITAEFLGEAINGDNFASGGADFALGPNNTFGFRMGGGNQRHSSEYKLNVTNGSLRFTEDLSYSSATTQPVSDLDFENITEQVQERSGLGFTIGPNLNFDFDFSRARSNQGSNQSNLSLRTSTNVGAFNVWLQPFYDFIRRTTSANLGFNLRLDKIHSLRETTGITEQGQTSAAVTWSKNQADDDDPLSMQVKLSASATQDRGFDIADDMSWASASFNYQQQNGVNTYDPELRGALALVGGNLFALRSVGDMESFGVLQIPGASNVRVKVNGSDAGTTNSNGTLLLRSLQPYRDNSIDVNGADLPIWYNLDDPLQVVPQKGAPVRLGSVVASRGAFTFRALDEQGVPLAAASDITLGWSHYPIGYGGRVFVPGLAPGVARFTALANGRTCTIEVDVPKDLTTIPDLGAARCLQKTADAPR
jgi:outer membrane usher protein